MIVIDRDTAEIARACLNEKGNLSRLARKLGVPRGLLQYAADKLRYTIAAKKPWVDIRSRRRQ